MKKIQVILGTFAIVILGSVAHAQEIDPIPDPTGMPPSFTLGTLSSSIYLVNQPGQSCTTQVMDPTGPQDVQPWKLSIGAIKLNWSGSDVGVMQIDYTKIILTSDQIQGGTQTLIYTGPELGFLWQGAPGLVIKYPDPNGNDQTSSAACNFEAGGINVKDPGAAITGHAKIIVGAETQFNGAPYNMTSEADFDFTSVP